MTDKISRRSFVTYENYAVSDDDLPGNVKTHFLHQSRANN